MQRLRGRGPFPAERTGGDSKSGSDSTIPLGLLGFYRLLRRKKVVTNEASSSNPADQPTPDTPAELIEPRRKTSSTIGRFLRNPFRKAQPSSQRGHHEQDEPSPSTLSRPPRRALSLRSVRAHQLAETPEGTPAQALSPTTDTPMEPTHDSDEVEVTPLRELPLLAPVLGQLRRREADSMHLRSASLPASSVIRLPQDLFAMFIFGCVFKRSSNHEYLNYFCKITETHLRFYLSDVKNESAVFSILLTELDPPVVKTLDADDAAGISMEQSCSLYSHGDPIADLLGPVKDISLFLTKLEFATTLSLDLIMSTAIPKSSSSRPRSLKDTYQLDIERSMGGYSFVKTGRSRLNSSQEVVLKFLPKEKNRATDTGYPSEADLLHRLKHPNIVELMDVYESNDYFVLLMQRFGTGLDLFEHLQNVERLPEHQASHVTRQVLSAVSYLAELGLVHGDIKDENIIVDISTMAIKLIDFGSSRELTATKSALDYTGTRYIACPEIVSQQTYEPIRQELWSVGVLLFIMLVGEYPFEQPEDILSAAVRPLGEAMRGSVTLECWGMIDVLLDPSPSVPVSIEAAIAHPWLTKK